MTWPPLELRRRIAEDQFEAWSARWSLCAWVHWNASHVADLNYSSRIADERYPQMGFWSFHAFAEPVALAR